MHTKHGEKYNQSPFRIWENRNIHQANSSNQNVVENIFLNTVSRDGEH